VGAVYRIDDIYVLGQYRVVGGRFVAEASLSDYSKETMCNLSKRATKMVTGLATGSQALEPEFTIRVIARQWFCRRAKMSGERSCMGASAKAEEEEAKDRTGAEARDLRNSAAAPRLDCAFAFSQDVDAVILVQSALVHYPLLSFLCSHQAITRHHRRIDRQQLSSR
jgi:hypothetical protein